LSLLAFKSVNFQGQRVPSATKISSRGKRQGLQMQTPRGLVQWWCDHHTPTHCRPGPWLMRECEKDAISKRKPVVGESTKSVGQSSRPAQHPRASHGRGCAPCTTPLFLCTPPCCVCHLQPEAMRPELVHNSQIRVNIFFGLICKPLFSPASASPLQPLSSSPAPLKFLTVRSPPGSRKPCD